MMVSGVVYCGSLDLFIFFLHNVTTLTDSPFSVFSINTF